MDKRCSYPVRLFLLLALLLTLAPPRERAEAALVGSVTGVVGQSPPAGLSSEAWTSIFTQLTQERYRFGAGDCIYASNYRQWLRFTFEADGVRQGFSLTYPPTPSLSQAWEREGATGEGEGIILELAISGHYTLRVALP